MTAEKKRTRYERLKHFLSVDIWEIERDNLSKVNRFLYSQLQIISQVLRGFVKDKCSIRATSLAFATMLTIVPFFAMLFPILRLFDAENNIRRLIVDKFAAGNEVVANKIFSMLDSIDFKIVGFAGIIFFIVVVVLIISNVERTINEIWGIKKNRPLLRKVTDFFSILVIVPIFVFLSTGITAYIKSQWYVQEIMSITLVDRIYGVLLSFSPYFSVWIAFTFFYLFIPNTKVKLKPAVIAGIVAGTLWQMAHAFVNFGYIIRRYDIIYGSLSKLPIFMLWIFYCWVIVLFGAEVAFAYQNIKTIRLEYMKESVSFAYYQHLALNVIISIADSYHHNKEPWDAQMLTIKYSTSLRLINEILFMLVKEGFLAEVTTPKRAYIPAFDIEQMSVYDIMHRLMYKGAEAQKRLGELYVNEKIKALIDKSELSIKSNYEGVTVRSLIT